MKGVILAGGAGTRLRPLTLAINKHLLPVYDKPAIYYAIEKLVAAGVYKIMIVTSSEHVAQFVKLLGSGEHFSRPQGGQVQIVYGIQNEPNGIAYGLYIAKEYIGNENCVLFLGDNIFEDDIEQHISSFKKGARIFLKKVPDPSRFGIASVDAVGKVTSIEEKPLAPKSDLAVTGLYIYDPTVFDKMLQQEKSARGEYEVTYLNNKYIDEGTLDAVVLEKPWFDIGTFDSLLEAGAFMRDAHKIPTHNDMEKVILVTGGAGFIGSHYLNWAVPRYPEYLFVNVDALTYAANQANILVGDAPNYRFVHADIRDRAAMTALFEEYHPTDVIHFAAESHVDNSIERPEAFIETNIVGTQILLDLARRHKIRRFHQISTDEVYGSLSETDAPTNEEAQLLPNSPYSASKAAGDLLVRSYHRTFGLDTVITRASNNYGPNQHHEKLIPRFITALKRGETVPVYGQGLNVRDWIYVGDHVKGIDAAFHAGKAGEIYNLGGGHELRNIEITRLLLALHGAGEERITYVTDRLGHDFRYAIDSEKAKRDLGWEPEMDFTEGLAHTWRSYDASAQDVQAED